LDWYIKHQWEQLSSNYSHSSLAFQPSKSSYGYEAGRACQYPDLAACGFQEEPSKTQLSNCPFGILFSLPSRTESFRKTASEFFRYPTAEMDLKLFNLKIPENLISSIFRLLPTL
jgi:hypothetical protein